jgi:hypothetical protein
MNRSLAVSASAILLTPAQARPPGQPVPAQHPFSRARTAACANSYPATPSPAHVRLDPGRPGLRVAMQALRQSQIAMTMEVYSDVPAAKTRTALKRLGRQLDD